MLLTLAVAATILAISTIASGALVYLAWTIILCSIFTALPVLTFWQCVGVGIALTILGGFFRSVVHSN